MNVVMRYPGKPAYNSEIDLENGDRTKVTY
jgi:hypothetical protein